MKNIKSREDLDLTLEEIISQIGNKTYIEEMEEQFGVDEEDKLSFGDLKTFAEYLISEYDIVFEDDIDGYGEYETIWE